MKMMWTMLTAVALSTGAALAQNTTTMTTGTTSTNTTVASTTATSGSQVTVMSSTTTMASCPVGLPVYPTPVAAKTSTDVNGKPIVLVLGSEEQYALHELGVRNLDWTDVSYNYPSIFSPGNPLSSSRVNPIVTRHGNPNYPYIVIDRAVRVAGMQERTMTFPTSVAAADRTTLMSVADRYRGLTRQQATSLGYQPLGACIPNVGQVYVNQSLVDNRFDAMMPEAFTFDQRGRLLAAHYIVLSTQPVMAFGQTMQPSPLVQGAYQLPVWLYRQNPNGLFTLTDTKTHCAAPKAKGSDARSASPCL